MSKKKNPCAGSSLESVLKEAGIFEEVQAEYLKSLITQEVRAEMEKANITHTELARKMGTSRAALRRILDPKNTSITLITISKVAQFLGKRVTISFG